MTIQNFKKLYVNKGESDETIEKAVDVIEDMEKYLKENNMTFDHVSLDVVGKYIDALIGLKTNDLRSFVAIARYFYLINNKEVYVHMTKFLSGIGVIENIRERMIKYAGTDVYHQVFDDLSIPPLGTSVNKLPKFTGDLMRKIKNNMEIDLYRYVLAGNNHRLSEESLSMEKEFYKNSSSLDDYLKERHDRKVQELQSHCDADSVWFEQIINQGVVDYVRANQEILSGVRCKNKLYVTKIPYDTNKFLKTEDHKEKNYHACHCPYARESILQNNSVDRDWCYCSGGFAKFPFEVIFERKLEVKVLESALNGDKKCRFEIDLKDMY